MLTGLALTAPSARGQRSSVDGMSALAGVRRRHEPPYGLAVRAPRADGLAEIGGATTDTMFNGMVESTR
jgi:hypothetical protein